MKNSFLFLLLLLFSVSSAGATAPVDSLLECYPNEHEIYADRIFQVGLDNPKYEKQARFLAHMSLSMSKVDTVILAVTLAQAGLESAYGRSKLATSNNLFGINYIRSSNYIDIATLIKGKTYNRGDRCYKSVFYTKAACLQYHEALLRGRYYKEGMSKKKLTRNLQLRGYAADRSYASKLNYIIKKFNL